MARANPVGRCHRQIFVTIVDKSRVAKVPFYGHGALRYAASGDSLRMLSISPLIASNGLTSWHLHCYWKSIMRRALPLPIIVVVTEMPVRCVRPPPRFKACNIISANRPGARIKFVHSPTICLARFNRWANVCADPSTSLSIACQYRRQCQHFGQSIPSSA